MADQVLYSGVACITDLMVKEGLINLDFADVRSIMSEMGKAMMGTGEATGEKRAVLAAEAAIANPLLDETSMRGARGLLISITGGNDLTLYEVDEAASRIRQEVDEEANIILGATFNSALDGVVRVSVVATGIDQAAISQIEPVDCQPRGRNRAPRTRADADARAGSRRPAAPAPVDALQPAPLVNDVEFQPVAPVAAASPSRSLRGARSRTKRAGVHSAAPEQPVTRAPRMPQIEDLPQVAQNQLRVMREAQAQRRAGNAAPVAAWKNWRRSASRATTRNRRRKRRARFRRPRPPPRPLPAPVTHADFGRAQPRPQPQPQRASAGALDQHGRPAHRPPVTEDDHLDIPAFLRRQQN